MHGELSLSAYSSILCKYCHSYSACGRLDTVRLISHTSSGTSVRQKTGWYVSSSSKLGRIAFCSTSVSPCGSASLCVSKVRTSYPEASCCPGSYPSRPGYELLQACWILGFEQQNERVASSFYAVAVFRICAGNTPGSSILALKSRDSHSPHSLSMTKFPIVGSLN